MNKITVCLMIAITVLFIAACGKSFEKEKVKAEDHAEQAFLNISPINETLDTIAFHLPTGLSIKNEEPNNIILEKGTHPYILFYNPNEDMKSEELYEMEKSNAENIVVDRTFNDDNRFGYLIIIEQGEDLYEVTVGIGGVKATTESKLNNIVTDTDVLMKMVSSAKIKE
ncbi:hypothetical protein [Bacillus sp. FSL K6-3431]|uniref:hypothetical protein n=1 Tax=Bacillus sp. FSL K6-3431 TaxID=2921500 RepID=UPI0030F7B63A